jgi:hypothetical protein
MAMACWTLIALIADRMTVISPNAAPAHVHRNAGFQYRQKSVWLSPRRDADFILPGLPFGLDSTAPTRFPLR